MAAGSPKTFRLFAVVGLKRSDLTESVVALRRDAGDARRFAGQCAAAMAGQFLRCKVVPAHLTLAQIKALWFRWGREDALCGAAVPNTLPGVYGEEYRRGYETACLAFGTATGGAPAAAPSEEAG